jgi:hypothetical protein
MLHNPSTLMGSSAASLIFSLAPTLEPGLSDLG